MMYINSIKEIYKIIKYSKKPIIIIYNGIRGNKIIILTHIKILSAKDGN